MLKERLHMHDAVLPWAHVQHIRPEQGSKEPILEVFGPNKTKGRAFVPMSQKYPRVFKYPIVEVLGPKNNTLTGFGTRDLDY